MPVNSEKLVTAPNASTSPKSGSRPIPAKHSATPVVIGWTTTPEEIDYAIDPFARVIEQLRVEAGF